MYNQYKIFFNAPCAEGRFPSDMKKLLAVLLIGCLFVTGGCLRKKQGNEDLEVVDMESLTTAQAEPVVLPDPVPQTTAPPETTTDAPETTTARSETTTDASETTAPSESTTAAPETTTAAPETTTAAPTTAAQKLSYPISYEDGGVRITIDKRTYLGTCCYIAHVQASDYGRIKTGVSQGGYGGADLPSAFGSSHNAMLVINGDYAEGDGKGVLRSGRIYGSGSALPDAAYSQKTGVLLPGNGATLSEMSAMGYTDSFGFGADPLVVDGVSVYHRKDGGKKTQRTLIGCTDTPGELYLVVTEGRYSDGTSPGLQYYEGGDLMESLGCKFAIALDGGNSSSMVWNGQVLDRNKDQKVSGFLYVTRP